MLRARGEAGNLRAAVLALALAAALPFTALADSALTVIVSLGALFFLLRAAKRGQRDWYGSAGRET